MAVLLRVDPSERPSAKQILYIPALQTYVNNVLARGRFQRSESVSCNERKDKIWRKLSVVPASGRNVFEDKSKSDVAKLADAKFGKFVVLQ